MTGRFANPSPDPAVLRGVCLTAASVLVVLSLVTGFGPFAPETAVGAGGATNVSTMTVVRAAP